MPKRALTAAVAAVLLVGGCQPGSHRAADHSTPTPPATASASPSVSSSASRPRLTAAQRKAAVLALADLPSGYRVETVDDPVPDNACVKRMDTLYSGSVTRTYTDPSETFTVVASVDTVAPGQGPARMRQFQDLTGSCGHFTLTEQGIRAEVTFAAESAPTLLDGSAGYVDTTAFPAQGSTYTLHLIAFRYGDNIGVVGVAADTGSHLASDTVALARKAAARMRDAAR